MKNTTPEEAILEFLAFYTKYPDQTNPVLYRQALRAYGSLNQLDKAIALFEKQKKAKKVTTATYNTLITVCSQDASKAEYYFQELRKSTNPRPDVHTFHAMIKMYTQLKDEARVQALKTELENEDLPKKPATSKAVKE